MLLLVAAPALAVYSGVGLSESEDVSLEVIVLVFSTDIEAANDAEDVGDEVETALAPADLVIRDDEEVLPPRCAELVGE